MPRARFLRALGFRFGAWCVTWCGRGLLPGRAQVIFWLPFPLTFMYT